MDESQVKNIVTEKENRCEMAPAGGEKLDY